MPETPPLYAPSLALLTDLYQLTMAQGYWRAGMADREAVFHLYFRRHPFAGGYTLACGLAQAVDWLAAFRVAPDDRAYLATLTGHDGQPLFAPAFLDWLEAMRPACDVDAVPEGTVVFPQEPLVRVRGPLAQAQIIETALLDIINFQTLVATKAARVVQAAAGGPVLEFGLRRAQGIDGGLAASRAAYIGGCAATSNVLAGKLYGIPVKGTHAHSWVLCFDDEPAAFRAYAEAMPNNCLFLVDTYDTLQGVRHAIAVGQALRARGKELLGIRLDSGDLAYLSREARRMLDEAGFPEAKVVASNDLDEYIIESLHRQDAAIAVWGVGTKLATAYEQPALGGVYKLTAIEGADGVWRDKLKLSEQALKINPPGILQVRRFYRAPVGETEEGAKRSAAPDGAREAGGDAIYDIRRAPPEAWTMIDPADPTRRKRFAAETPCRDLLEPVFRKGERVGDLPPIAETRAYAARELSSFHEGVKRLVHPHAYPVGFEAGLHQHRTELILQARGHADPESS